MLTPSDIASLLYLHLYPADTYGAMAERLGISKSTAHGSVRRLLKNRLIHESSTAMARVAEGSALDFLCFGVPYVFAPDTVPAARGVPTGLRSFAQNDADTMSGALSLVWPSRLGDGRGIGIAPLVPAAVELPARDPKLYRLLALVDALRIGDAREREVARTILRGEFTRAPA
jgi:DNA-binding Lrp family transcriptional regulator